MAVHWMEYLAIVPGLAIGAVVRYWIRGGRFTRKDLRVRYLRLKLRFLPASYYVRQDRKRG